MNVLSYLFLLYIIKVAKRKDQESYISVLIDKNPVRCVEGESILLPVSVIGTDNITVSWWGPADRDRAWDNGVQGNSTKYKDRVSVFLNGSIQLHNAQLIDSGEWVYTFFLSGSLLKSNVQYVPGRIILQVLSKPTPKLLRYLITTPSLATTTFT